MNVSDIKGIIDDSTADPVAGYEFFSSSNYKSLKKIWRLAKWFPTLCKMDL